MINDFLSDVELYYTPKNLIGNDSLKIEGDECKHIATVMRHRKGDVIYVTNGEGVIYKTCLNEVSQNLITADIIELYKYEDDFKNVYLCLPRLKSNDRFEYALEKSVELGISNFIVFDADKSVVKGRKLIRWQKIAIAAMKQSLRSFMPEMNFKNHIDDIVELRGIKILFDQKAEQSFVDYVNSERESFKSEKNYYFIFGPEGGISQKELEKMDDVKIVKLTGNRLRTETAVVTAASIITTT
ncbi:MAG: RsmE family RNA methyltransferase [Ignavibacteria bacterium]